MEDEIDGFARAAAREAEGCADPEALIIALAKRRYNRMSEAEKRPYAEAGLLAAAPDRRFRTRLAHEMFRRGMERAVNRA